MKDIELRLIKELIKNSRRSDREIAKKLCVSQPTVSRVRIRLEKEKMLNYTTIPDLPKLGFGIIAVILGRRHMQRHPENHTKEAADFAKEHPNIIFAADGNGVGFDRVGISIQRLQRLYAVHPRSKNSLDGHYGHRFISHRYEEQRDCATLIFKTICRTDKIEERAHAIGGSR